ncbi:MAG: phosphate ABC transporter permease PstA [Acidobacteria bacterium]|nr:phosphate ABC transporter permease PstA [Acidobacteriota bacterium]
MRWSWRKVEETFFRCLMMAAVVLVMLILLWILLTILVRGVPALDWEMVSRTPRGGFYLGKSGGILNAILGSLFLTLGATLAAFVAGLPVALYLTCFRGDSSRTAAFIRTVLDVLWGIPSIVYGAFGFVLMIWLGLRASLLGGMLAVALLILPIMIRGMDEVIRLVPRELYDSAYALGATKMETAFRVVIRQAAPGILSTVLIALGRGMGDAASVLFTAGYTDALPSSLLEPVATLPLAIFFQLGTPFPEVQERAYASALLLTILILVISGVARWLIRRYARQVVR